MTTISEIRTGIATRLATIEGLRVHDFVPSEVNPPAAIVFGPEIDYDQTMRRGSDDYRFTVILMVSKVSDRAGQNLLDFYIAPSGVASVKAVIEGEGGNLGGTVDFARVKGVGNYGPTEVGALSFFGAEVYVEVTASGE
jgi:hypothetical protein